MYTDIEKVKKPKRVAIFQTVTYRVRKNPVECLMIGLGVLSLLAAISLPHSKPHFEVVDKTSTANIIKSIDPRPK